MLTTQGYSEHLRFKTERYWAVIRSGEMEKDEDGVCWWVWQGTYSSLKGSALVSAVSPNADDAVWAEKILRSVQPDSDSISVAATAEF